MDFAEPPSPCSTGGIPFRDEFVQQVASGAGVGYLVEPDRPEARSVVDALAPVLANVLNPVPI